MRKHVINKVYTGDLNSLEDIKQGELIIDDTFNNELISFKNDRGLFVSVETKTSVDKKINTKQNITDELLQTETKEIVPAINEVLNDINTVQDTLEETKKELSANISSINNIIDSINQDIQQNTNKINDVNTDLSSQISSVNTELTEYINTVNSELTSQISSVNKYVTEVTDELTTNVNNLVESTTESFTEVNKNIEDINIELNEKQDKEDSSLNTEDKTIVGAINELKDDIAVLSSSDLLDLSNRIDGVANDVTNNTDNINFLLDTKQDKEDSGLETNSNTIVGAINEVNSKIPDISNLAKQSDLNELKEKVNTNTTNISNLTTNVNTNTNSINTINSTLSTLAKQSDLTILSNKVTTNTNNISTNTNNISSLTTKVNTNTSDITNLKNNKQDKSDNSLNTNNKTVIGGINELKTKIDNIDTELDKKQDKEDNNLQTDTKTVVGAINELNNEKQDKYDTNLNTVDETVVGGINELDSKLKAEEFAGGLKVKLANDGTAIITTEGIRVLDSNNVEKIKLIDGDIDIDDAKKYTTTTVSPVADSTLTLPSDSTISTTYKDSKSINVSGNVSKILLSMYKDVSITCKVSSTSTVARSEDYEYIVNIGDYAVRTYEINISIPANSTTATIKYRLKGETTWSTGSGFDITCSDYISYNNFQQVSNYFNVVLKKVTPNTSVTCTITVQIASQGSGRYCNVSIYNMTNGMDKTLIGFNGFLTFHDFNTYFTAYTDANNQYRIIGRGDVVDIKKNS